MISVWCLVKSNCFDVVIVNDYDNFYAFSVFLVGEEEFYPSLGGFRVRNLAF